LLLPLDAPDFAPPALAVQKGCEAAIGYAEVRPRLEVARVDADPDRVADAWQAASARGASIIVGPLTRTAVTALATALARQDLYGSKLSALGEDGKPLPAPLTLTLNSPEDVAVLPPGFYTFGLVVEQEARAAARLAWGDGKRNAVVLQSANALARRASQAFAAEWQALGGRIADVQDLDPAGASESAAKLKARVSADADMLFLSADAREARRVRPYLGAQPVIYATSQVHDGRSDPGANVDLAGIRFVDMPWLLQADHPAVMVYPRLSELSPVLQRFYALGIDACRIAGHLLARRSRVDLDGVTGHLLLNANPSGPGAAVQREPQAAMFGDPPPPALPPPAAQPPS
jgi:outer membrane PBP1 activator LpoA protein